MLRGREPRAASREGEEGTKEIEGGPRKVEQPPVVLVSVTRRMVP